MTLARQFRRAGIECLLEYKARGLKAHLGRASKLEASWVLIVGDDELQSRPVPSQGDGLRDPDGRNAGRIDQRRSTATPEARAAVTKG